MFYNNSANYNYLCSQIFIPTVIIATLSQALLLRQDKNTYTLFMKKHTQLILNPMSILN